MKFYKDEQGNLYKVDRETGERELVQQDQPGDADGPETQTADDNEE